MQLLKSITEKFMGRRLALFTDRRDGRAWLSTDGVMSGPYDDLEDGERALERMRTLIRLQFYATSHREARRRP